MSLMSYLYGGVGKCLDTPTPKIVKAMIVRLHNIVHHIFRQKVSYELTITFDNKKININAIDEIHDIVRKVLTDEHFEYIVMREWSKAGTGRLHYHGIIMQKSGGQTELAKMKSLLKRIFGRDCRINYISFYDSYIKYMLKRTMQEHSILIHEWFSSICIHNMLNDDTEIPVIYDYDLNALEK